MHALKWKIKYNLLVGKLEVSLATSGLQVTVGHRTLADENLLMSDEIANVVGHDVRTNILS